MMTYVGIDPGANGGLAAIGASQFTYSFSTFTLKDITECIQGLASFEEIFIMLEDVRPLPSFMRGSRATVSLAKNCGLILGVLYTIDKPFELTIARSWQKALSCLSGGNKNVTKTKAQQLFPKLKVTHAVADALLIAEYCRRLKGADYGANRDPLDAPVRPI